MIITTSHLRTVPGLRSSPGFCVDKSRAWFARHGLDWRAFVRDGVDEQVLTATGCALALRLVEHAHSREAASRGQQ